MSKNTKIVATIGPASFSVEVLKKMILSGMNVARLNFSHSDHTWHASAIRNIREAEKQTGLPVAIMADLQGPRMRTVVSLDTEVFQDELVVFCEANALHVPLSEKRIGIDHERLLSQLKPGQSILVEDGKISFSVEEVRGAEVVARVLHAGTIKNHKGVNFPGSHLKLSALSEKDKSDLEFACSEGVEYIALSFVGSSENVKELRGMIAEHVFAESDRPHIVVKIEREEAIENLAQIIASTDAVMVARGDLATEAGQEKIGFLQKEIIEQSLLGTKPVIVATQMLESMIENTRPTRAEISDVAHAVMDHADAVMLSGESANGKYPVECVKTMADIIESTEKSPYDDVLETLETKVDTQYIDMIRGMYELAKHGESKLILAVTKTGETARLLSHFRPQIQLLAITPDKHSWRRMMLYWGVESFLDSGEEREDVLLEMLIEKAKQSGRINVEEDITCIYRGADSGLKKVEMRKVL